MLRPGIGSDLGLLSVKVVLLALLKQLMVEVLSKARQIHRSRWIRDYTTARDARGWFSLVQRPFFLNPKLDPGSGLVWFGSGSGISHPGPWTKPQILAYYGRY